MTIFSIFRFRFESACAQGVVGGMLIRGADGSLWSVSIACGVCLLTVECVYCIGNISIAYGTCRHDIVIVGRSFVGTFGASPP